MTRLAFCLRCQKPCVISDAPAPAVDYGGFTLRPATSETGLCAECAAHWWLLTVDGIRWALVDGFHAALAHAGPDLFRREPVQAELAGVLGKMHPALAMLDWERLIDQWGLPWPAGWALPEEPSR